MKIFICVLLHFKSFASISRPFQVRSVLFAEFNALFLRESCYSMLFSDFSAHLSKFSQLKFRESVQFTNIAKILPRENLPLYGSCIIIIIAELYTSGIFSAVSNLSLV